MLLSEAVKNFITWKSLSVKGGTIKAYTFILRHFTLYMRNPELEEVELDEVTSWFSLMGELGWESNGFIPKACALREFFAYWDKQNYRVVDPSLIPLPSKEYTKARVLTDPEYSQLLSAIPSNNDPRHIRNLAMINMFFDTGARNTEVCSLDISDLDLEKRRAVIRTAKSKGYRPVREVFWTPKTNGNLVKWIEKREHLSKLMEFKEPEALFISLVQKNGQRLTTKGVGEMLRRYSHKANIPIANAHSFRHAMGHRIVRKNGSAHDVSNILGHSSLASSFRYTQMRDNELHERYEKFMEN